jgi:hypothetical protein
MKLLQRTAARGVSLLAVLLLAGCPFSPDKDEGPPPPPPPTFLARTSPQNLLNNLREAYKQRSIAEYESLLSRDFTFLLSAEDAAKPDIPDQWGRDVEIIIHGKMFDAEMVQSLTLDFAVGDLIKEPADNLYTVMISNVNLFLWGSTPSHPGDPKEYRVSNSRAKFWFRRNGWIAPGTSDSTWSVVKWEDNPAS